MIQTGLNALGVGRSGAIIMVVNMSNPPKPEFTFTVVIFIHHDANSCHNFRNVVDEDDLNMLKWVVKETVKKIRSKTPRCRKLSLYSASSETQTDSWMHREGLTPKSLKWNGQMETKGFFNLKSSQMS